MNPVGLNGRIGAAVPLPAGMALGPGAGKGPKLSQRRTMKAVTLKTAQLLGLTGAPAQLPVEMAPGLGAGKGLRPQGHK